MVDEAANVSDADLIERLLDAGFEYSNYSVANAASCGDLNSVKLLVSRGAPVTGFAIRWSRRYPAIFNYLCL